MYVVLEIYQGATTTYKQCFKTISSQLAPVTMQFTKLQTAAQLEHKREKFSPMVLNETLKHPGKIGFKDFNKNTFPLL